MSAPKCGWATPEDWTMHQDRITALYAEHTLREVQQIMVEKYSFNATTKMYKTHFSRWKLHKNLRPHVAYELVRQNHPSDGLNCLLGGKQIDQKRLNAYVHRVWRRQVARTASTPLPRPMPAGVASVAEECFHYLRVYVSGSFEVNLWATNWQVDSQFNVYSWFDGIFAVKRALNRGDARRGFRILNLCLEQFKRHLSIQAPYLFIITYLSILELYQGHPDIARLVIGYLCDISSIVYPSSHPFSLLMRKLRAMSCEDIRLSSLHFLEFYTTAFDAHLDPGHAFSWEITRVRAVTTSWLASTKVLTADAAEPTIRQCVLKLERNAPGSFAALSTKHRLADLLYFSAKLGEAEELATEMLRSEEVRHQQKIIAHCHATLFRIVRDRGRHQEALSLARRRIGLCIAEFGASDDITVAALTDLEEYLRQLGHGDLAEKAAADVESALDGLCARLEQQTKPLEPPIGATTLGSL